MRSNFSAPRRTAPVLWHLVMLLLLPGAVHAQHSAGTILGFLPENRPALGSEYRLNLRAAESGASIQEVVAGTNGQFRFEDVPFGNYYLTVTADSVLVTTRLVSITSTVPVAVNFESLPVPQTKEINVTAPRAFLVDRKRPGSGRSYNAMDIEDLTSPSGDRKIESMLLATPGVVPDEDGRMHIRGEDAQILYVIDGIPVTGNLTRVYSGLFNASLIKSADVLTSHLDAQYGVEGAGIVDLTTQSGFDRPLFFNATVQGGSLDSREASIEGGGKIGSRTGLFVAGDRSLSDRYLDPITGGEANHDSGEANHLFAKLNSVLSDRLRLSVLGGFDATDYDVPNSRHVEPAQDQRQRLRSTLAGARLESDLTPLSRLSLLGYSRRVNARITSGGLMELNSAADRAKAIAENEKLFIGGERTNTTTGGQVEYSATPNWMNRRHDFKAGIGGEVYPLDEFFTFAVTNPALSDSNAAGGDSRYLPYDITQGGSPFRVDASKTGRRGSVYVQDAFPAGRFRIRAGLRFDTFHLFETENSVSPRFAISWAASDRFVLRAGYQRIVMQAPVENILVSSSDEARMLTGAAQVGTPTRVRSEKSHVAEIGLLKQWNPHLDLDFSIYAKRIDDFIVKTELENSGVIFPVNLKDGFVAGSEIVLTLRRLRNLSGSFSLSANRSVGLKPEDGSSPVSAGLILGEEGRNYSDPWEGESFFKTEHNQLITAVLDLVWQHPRGAFATFGGRFDSGLPFDLVGSDGRGLNEEESRQELRNRGYSDDVIDLLNLHPEKPGSPDKAVAPHTVFDVGAGYDFTRTGVLPIRVSVSVMNVLDTDYLYKFESSFGATHFGRPRTVVAQVDYKY